MAVLEALTTGDGTITEKNLKVTMKSYLGKDVELTGNGPWQYFGKEGAYTITQNGIVAKGWVYKYDENGVPEKVTNGNITLNIGDYINYNPGTEASYVSPKGTEQLEKTDKYNVVGIEGNSIAVWECSKASEYQDLLEKGQIEKGNGLENQVFSVKDSNQIKWKVLGVNEENGELLIIAADELKSDDGITKKFTLKGITGYLYGKDELNKICEIYGNGKGATGGRCIVIDDINKTIGRKSTTNTIKYTYTWNKNSLDNYAPSFDGGSNYMKYYHVKKDDNEQRPGTLGIFNFYNKESGKWESNVQELNGFSGKKKICTISQEFAGYHSITEAQKNTNGYNVLFKTNDGKDIAENENNGYWVASPYVYADERYVGYDLYCVYGSKGVIGATMYYSFGAVFRQNLGIRPVISLESEIQLEKNPNVENMYNIK